MKQAFEKQYTQAVATLTHNSINIHACTSDGLKDVLPVSECRLLTVGHHPFDNRQKYTLTLDKKTH